MHVFNSTILNILSNFTPQKSVVCDVKDQPCFNKKIRALTQERNVTFKNYHNNNSNIDLKCRLKYLQASANVSVEAAKENIIIL